MDDITSGLTEYKEKFLEIKKELNSHVEAKKGPVFNTHYEPKVIEKEVPVRTYRTLWGLIGSETKTVPETIKQEVKVKVDMPYEMDDAVNLVEESCRNIEGSVGELEKLVERVAQNTESLKQRVIKGYYELSEAVRACKDYDGKVSDLKEVQENLVKEMDKIDWYNPEKPKIQEELLNLRGSITEAEYSYTQNGDRAMLTKNFISVLDKFQHTLENTKFDTKNKIDKFSNLVRGLRAVTMVGDNIYRIHSVVADMCGYAIEALDDVRIVANTSSKLYNGILQGDMQITDQTPADIQLIEHQAQIRKQKLDDKYDSIKQSIDELSGQKYKMD